MSKKGETWLKGMEEIAKFCRVCENTVLKMRKKGLPVYRTDGGLRANPEDLRDWLRQQQR